MFNYRVSSGPYFPDFGLNAETYGVKVLNIIKKKNLSWRKGYQLCCYEMTEVSSSSYELNKNFSKLFLVFDSRI